MDLVTPAVHTLSKVRYPESDRARAIAWAIRASRDIEIALPVVFGGRVIGATLGIRGVPAVFWRPMTHRQWAGFPNYAELEQAVQRGQVVQGFHLNKSDISASGQGFRDYWPVGGIPFNGTYAGAAATARQFDDTTVGGLQNHFRPGGTRTTHLYQVIFGGVIQGFMLYDRVLAYDAEVISNVSTVMTNALAAQRYIAAGEPGLVILATNTTGTALGATAATLDTLTYVDNDGNAGQLMPTDTVVNWAVSTQVAGNSIGAQVVAPQTAALAYSPFLPLQPGDTGVRSITDYQSSANNTGQVCFALVRPLGWLTFAATDMVHKIEFGRNLMAMDRVYDGACLSLLVTSGGQSRFSVDLKLAWG